jgi:PIN domain nuclease of toxin-antitoxin system
MKYLLDTMIWLWSVGPIDRISRQGLAILQRGDEEIYFSAASSWEIAIKTQLGKYRLPEAPAGYIPKRLTEQGIRPLSITQSHALRVQELPLHHRDPFDRLLVAQALAEEMTILTADPHFTRYRVQLVWCGKNPPRAGRL